MMMLRAKGPLSRACQRSSCVGGLRFAALSSSSSNAKFDNVLVERRERVGIVTFDRPKALNALNSGLIQDICSAAEAFEGDPEVGAIVLTGSDRAFAAGADIKEMASLTFSEAYGENRFKEFARLTSIRKPVRSHM
ncbi:unnamed protein product [Ectocarpus sp. 12 AP-2014]